MGNNDLEKIGIKEVELSSLIISPELAKARLDEAIENGSSIIKRYQQSGYTSNTLVDSVLQWSKSCVELLSTLFKETAARKYFVGNIPEFEKLSLIYEERKIEWAYKCVERGINSLKAIKLTINDKGLNDMTESSSKSENLKDQHDGTTQSVVMPQITISPTFNNHQEQGFDPRPLSSGSDNGKNVETDKTNITNRTSVVYFLAFLGGFTTAVGLSEYFRVKPLETKITELKEDVAKLNQSKLPLISHDEKSPSKLETPDSTVKEKPPKNAKYDFGPLWGYRILVNYNKNSQASFALASKLKNTFNSMNYNAEVELNPIVETIFYDLGLDRNRSDVFILYDNIRQLDAGKKFVSILKNEWTNKHVEGIGTSFNNPDINVINVYLK